MNNTDPDEHLGNGYDSQWISLRYLIDFERGTLRAGNKINLETTTMDTPCTCGLAPERATHNVTVSPVVVIDPPLLRVAVEGSDNPIS